MHTTIASKYEIYWGRGQTEEFCKLQDALDARDNFIDCFGGDDDEYIPSIYAVLENDMKILLK